MVDRGRTLLLACLLLAGLSLAACHPTVPEGELVQAAGPRIQSPEASDVQVAQLTAGNNAFAFDLYHTVTARDGSNLIYSPYSISLVFSTLYAGARGQAEEQMAHVLHFLPQAAQHPAFNTVDLRLQKLGQAQPSGDEDVPFQLDLANAVWGQRGYAFQQAYLDLLAAQYGAGLRVVDFQGAPEQARAAINAWVAQETQQRIVEIAAPGSVSADTLLVLVNAIFFRAGWYHPFAESDTTDGAFTLLDGSQVTVPLMHQKIRLEYAEGGDYQAVQLPYVGQAVDMWVILPAEGRFQAVERRLGTGLLEEAQQGVDSWRVILTLPRFGFGTELRLHELLPEMGMESAFCPAVDFEGIAKEGGLCVDYALHRATIAVDEKGTEAAAATMGAIMVSEVKDVEMTVDRPFLFAIVARERGALLFLGRVLDPSAG